jgi:tetratricopeptide (TPR) repeat protein
VQYRPLLPLSLSLNWSLGTALGLDELVAFHAGNLAIHGISVVLFYLFFLVLLQRYSAPAPDAFPARATAFVAAALYAVHPISGVPVNYLCARDLLLMQAFLTAALLLYVRFCRQGFHPAGWVGVIVCLALSILSKTNAAAAPALIFLIEFVWAREPLKRFAPWIRIVPWVLVVGGFFVWTKWILQFSDADQLLVERASPLEYPLTQARIHWSYYLRNFVWPFRMRPLPWIEVATLLDFGAWIGLSAITATLGLAWWLFKRLPLLSFSILAYWVMFAPTSSILPFRMLAADYRQYPSLPYLCLALAVCLAGMAGTRVRWSVAAAALLYFGCASRFILNPVWATEESLWQHSVRYGATTTAHHNYARSVSGKDAALAEQHYREAIRMEPGNVFSHINLGLLLMGTDRVEEGLKLVRRAVTLVPDWALAHYWLSRALSQLGEVQEAAAESARASDLDPRQHEHAYQAAYDAQLVGDYPASLRYLERLHSLVESHKESLFLQGFALQQTGALEASIPTYRKFLQQQPSHYQAHFNLAHALMRTGQYEQAIPEFEKTLLLKPGYTEVHYHLSNCFRRLGRSAEAAHHTALYQAAGSQQ